MQASLYHCVPWKSVVYRLHSTVTLIFSYLCNYRLVVFQQFLPEKVVSIHDTSRSTTLILLLREGFYLNRNKDSNLRNQEMAFITEPTKLFTILNRFSASPFSQPMEKVGSTDEWRTDGFIIRCIRSSSDSHTLFFPLYNSSSMCSSKHPTTLTHTIAIQDREKVNKRPTEDSNTHVHVSIRRIKVFPQVTATAGLLLSYVPG